MPIFEHNDEFSAKEFKRQQREIELKLLRKSFSDYKEKPSKIVESTDNFDGGDCWLNEI